MTEHHLTHACSRCVQIFHGAPTHYVMPAGSLDQISYTLCGKGFSEVLTSDKKEEITCEECRKALQEGKLRPVRNEH